MIKWIIFYVAMHGNIDESPMGEILFFEGDSVKVFSTVWKITSMDNVAEYRDKIYMGVFNLAHKGINCQISVLGEEISIIFDGSILISAKQRPHYEYLYEDIDEEYSYLNKQIDKEKKQK